jgi:phenylacetate-coenzyme A ligase PaaK-like adenylate-forming protein
MRPALALLAPHSFEPEAGWESEIALACARWAAAVADACLTAMGTRDAADGRARERLASLVAFARAHSPYFREVYRDVEDPRPALSSLPIVTRRALMARFDDWVTDPQIKRSSVEGFVADVENVGHAFLGRYAVWKSSGTTGEPGLFVHDANALALYDALDSVRLGSGVLGPAAALNTIVLGARYAMIAVTGSHYAGVSSIERLRLVAPGMSESLRVFSIFEPLPQLVDELNHWQPAFVATHPSAASVLATEQRAGRLRIQPAAFWLGGEDLSVIQRENIKRAFECTVLEQYGASECLSIACECARGALHLNADWVMLEPVDREFRPVPAGVMSHTVLLTNLANRVQPIIRYDLGDSVLIEDAPCACGSPFPVLRLEGRADEVIRLQRADGQSVDLLPVALTTLIEECVASRPFQVVRTGANMLNLRIEGTGEDDGGALWNRACRALREYLEAQDLSNVSIQRDARPVAVNARSGKLQRIVSRP